MILARPLFKWLLFALCVALFVAAMAWVTHRMIGMDRQHEASEREAQVQEKMRLALWRMDSLVSSLLIRENSRPPSHYEAFHSPEDLFSNRSQRELPKGEAVMPSPLLGEPPEFVHLHFQMMPVNGLMTCASPQVPTGKDLSLANNWYVISPQLDAARQRLDKLNAILQRHPNALATALPERKQAPSPPPAPVSAALPESKPADALADRKMDAVQMIANSQEFQQRANVTSNFLNNGKLSVEELPKKKMAEKPPEPSSSITRSSSSGPAVTVSGGRTLAKNESKDKAMAPAPTVASSAAKSESAAGSILERFKSKVAPQSPAAPAARRDGGFADSLLKPVQLGNTTAAVTNGPSPSSPPSLPDDLKPRWLEDELLLTRTAVLDNESRLQGLWLDWPKLRQRLEGTIKDLLPNAELSATDPAWLDASSMVTLPVRLLPGKVILAMAEPSPLRRSLVIAWACFLIAATAVGIVLNRAMMLSERRGAFVSAVTHELRTPLTTFQLYSEMLADDMVPDADKRREYLRTLCDESTRLTHLVENVLSYSRIERGRASARREDLLLSDLIARIEPRLRQRTQPTCLDLIVTVATDAAETRVNVDALAVEQIIFNLVDNACKYAAPASTEKALRVEVTVEPKQAVVRVRDHGPGLTKQQLKRLFRPFEKSATEAAHSAPGVGLGLALCRRLARELGGDLVLESSDAGACFRFSVPRQDS